MISPKAIVGLLLIAVVCAGGAFAGDLPEKDVVIQKDVEAKEQNGLLRTETSRINKSESGTFTPDRGESRDNLEQEDMICDLIDSGVLPPALFIHMILQDKEEINRWIAVLTVMGWTLAVVLLIALPPAGLLAALLTLIGVKISMICGVFALGGLFGAW